VKHAGPETFDQLQDLLAELREIPELNERKTGVFYRRSRAFLHFHDDPTGPYADVRLADDSDFVRIRVKTAAEKKRLVREVRVAARS
jgi:hypothetical protein